MGTLKPALEDDGSGAWAELGVISARFLLGGFSLFNRLSASFADRFFWIAFWRLQRWIEVCILTRL
jgi:hypothetical protein